MKKKFFTAFLGLALLMTGILSFTPDKADASLPVISDLVGYHPSVCMTQEGVPFPGCAVPDIFGPCDVRLPCDRENY